MMVALFQSMDSLPPPLTADASSSQPPSIDERAGGSKGEPQIAAAAAVPPRAAAAPLPARRVSPYSVRPRPTASFSFALPLLQAQHMILCVLRRTSSR